jgi:DNA-binding GntR family transcriptional regulator
MAISRPVGGENPPPIYQFTPADLPGDKGTPLYLRVCRAITAGIEEGRIAVGSLLPTENDLAQQLGVSRQTVRQAIGLLRQQGLLSARKGIGTRVEAQRPDDHSRFSVKSAADLRALAKEAELHIRQRRELAATGVLATELGCRPGKVWLHLGGPRYLRGDALPFCWNDVYLDPRLGDVVAGRDMLDSPIFLMIEQATGERIEAIRQEIRAVAMPADKAEALTAPVGSPALSISRRYLGSGARLLEMSVMLFPADRFVYATTFTPDLPSAG